MNSGPVARITMGNLVFAIYWDTERQQAEVYDTSRNQFEHVDTITGRNIRGGPNHPFDLISTVIEYGSHLGFIKIDEIAI